MLAVVQIGSSTLRSECMTARIVLVWARAGATTTREAATESRTLTFTSILIAGGAPLQWRSSLVRTAGVPPAQGHDAGGTPAVRKIMSATGVARSRVSS